MKTTTNQYISPVFCCPCGFKSEFLSIVHLHTESCEIYEFRTDPKMIIKILGKKK